MLKEKRIGRLVLGLLLAMVLAVPALADGASISISAPETLPAVGETFTVTVEIRGNPGLCAAQFTLAFDETVLSCESAEAGEVLAGALAVANPTADEGAIFAAASTTPARQDGAIAVFTFKVRRAGEAAFALKDSVFRNEKGEVLQVSAAGTEGPAQPEQPEAPGAERPETGETAPGKGATFTDVPTTHWGYEMIERAAALGYINGVGDGRFDPDRALTRAEFVTMLWRMAGKPVPEAGGGFLDVSADDWYYNAVSWAFGAGVVNGASPDTFDPDGKITRQEVVTILFRYSGGQSGAELMFASAYESQYSDSGEIAAWAKNAVYWAIYNGVINGTDGHTVSPAGTATRAQVAAILVRYAQ